MFEPGRKKTGGRKKGVLNKATNNYLDLQNWFKMITDGAQELEVGKRIEVAFRAIDTLFSKIQTLPGVPGESVENAKQTMEMLKAFENQPSKNGDGAGA